MIEISGKLVSKSFMETGSGKFGEWRRIEFVIEKTFNKELYSIPFTA